MWYVYFKGYAGPPSTLPASVNTWRPTIAKLIDCDRLYAIRALLYYSYSVREINVERFCTFSRSSTRHCESLMQFREVYDLKGFNGNRQTDR